MKKTKKKTKKQVPKPRDFTQDAYTVAFCDSGDYDPFTGAFIANRTIEVSSYFVLDSDREMERFEKWYAKAKAWVNDA